MAQRIITGTRLFVVTLFLLERSDGGVDDIEVVREKCKTKTKLKLANEKTLYTSMIRLS